MESREGPAVAGRDRDPRLELVPKLYQRSVFPAVEQVSKGKTLPAPLVVDLDPTTFCDLSCPECISGELLNKGRFSDARLAELVQELVDAGVKAVILIGGGEPLAHPGIKKVLRVLGPAGLRIGLVTNGTQLLRHADLIARFASWVRVSVDAGSDQTYRMFRPDRRGRSRFNQVIENMRTIAPAMTGDLGYSFLLMERSDEEGRTVVSNYGEVEQAGRLAKELGCRYFEVKAMFDMGHFIVSKPRHLVEQIEEQVRALEELEDEDFSVVASSTMSALRNGSPREEQKEYHRCNVAELRTLLTSNGAYICPYHRGNPRARLGDPVSQPFRDLWANADRQIIDPSVDCRFHCARHEQNLEIDLIGSGQGAWLPTDDYDLFI
jgi:pyruvate-formate lyase-activating enzyme